MAASVWGFKFDNGYFFNCMMQADEENLLMSENGGAHVAGLATEKAAHMGIAISENFIAVECKMGGIECRDGTLVVGPLFGPAMAKDAAPQEQPPSRDSGAPPSSSASSRAATPTMSGGSRAATPLPSLSSDRQEASMRWTHEAILLLIEEHLQKKEHFASSTYRKIEVWALVAAALREKGHLGATAEACDKKWRNLKMSYKTNREKAKKTGAGRMTWPYYDLMDDQLFHDPGIQPSRTAGSLCGVQSHTERHRFRSPPSAEDSSRSSVSSPSHPSPSDLNLDLAQPGPSTGASQAHCQPGTSHGRSSASPGRSSASPGRSGPSPGRSGASPGRSGASPGRSGASPGRSGRGRKRRASWMSDPPQWILDQTEVLRQIAGTLDTFVKLKQDVLRRLEDEDKN